MKIKINRVDYSQLRNDEFPFVYEQTVMICEKHNVNSIHLGKSYDELVSFRPEIESLKVYLRKNKKFASAGNMDVERDTLTNTLNRVVKGYENVDLPEYRLHYDVLSALLLKHDTKTIAKDTRAAETERLQGLEADINSNTEAQAAIAFFGLTPLVTRLFEANREYIILFHEYIAEKGSEQYINVPLLRSTCSKSLVQFLDAVQYSAYVYEDVDYKTLINELIKLNQYYSQQLKARATRRKNGKKTNEEPPIQPPENL
jgi:hypothetical protein